MAWLSLPNAIFPSGTRTAQLRPAAVAYAAADAEVLPVDAQMTLRAPPAFAWVIAVVIPRSLNEPVGFTPSHLSQTSHRVSSDRYAARTSGVPPSPSVTMSAC